MRDRLITPDASRPSLEMIPVGQLQVDGQYQRLLQPKRVQKMVESFDWSIFFAVGVSRRIDGSLWVFDGQHRIAAVLDKFGPTERVPAIVIDALSVEDEARIFNELQTTRRPLTPADRFRARLIAGDEYALALRDEAEVHGFHVTTDYTGTTDGRVISAVAALESLQRQYATGVGPVLSVIADAWHHQYVATASIIRAIGEVMHMAKDQPRFSRERLVDVLGTRSPDEWLIESKAMRRVYGGRPTDWVMSVIVRDYNNRLHGKNKLGPRGEE